MCSQCFDFFFNSSLEFWEDPVDLLTIQIRKPRTMPCFRSNVHLYLGGYFCNHLSVFKCFGVFWHCLCTAQVLSSAVLFLLTWIYRRAAGAWCSCCWRPAVGDANRTSGASVSAACRHVERLFFNEMFIRAKLKCVFALYIWRKTILLAEMRGRTTQSREETFGVSWRLLSK